MSKEKEMLKTILANTNAIIEHLKITNAKSSDKKADDVAKPSSKAEKSVPAKAAKKSSKK